MLGRSEGASEKRGNPLAYAVHRFLMGITTPSRFFNEWRGFIRPDRHALAPSKCVPVGAAGCSRVRSPAGDFGQQPGRIIWNNMPAQKIVATAPASTAPISVPMPHA